MSREILILPRASTLGVSEMKFLKSWKLKWCQRCLKLTSPPVPQRNWMKSSCIAGGNCRVFLSFPQCQPRHWLVFINLPSRNEGNWSCHVFLTQGCIFRPCFVLLSQSSVDEKTSFSWIVLADANVKTWIWITLGTFLVYSSILFDFESLQPFWYFGDCIAHST